MLTEAQEQTLIFQWAKVFSGRYPVLNLLYHTPNGGKRNPKEAARFKAEGVKAGVPDMFLPYANKGYHGLYIELKRVKGGTLSDKQKEWIEALREQGYKVEVCKGADAAIEVLTDYITGE